MRISMKVDYSVRALVDLALHPGEAAHSVDIAARQNIPQPYLDQLLTTLSKFGLVRSRRGPGGGHTLARSAGEITLDMVMTTMEGTNSIVSCLDDSYECSMAGACAQRDVWQSVEAAIQGVLSAITIADLAKRQNTLSAASAVPVQLVRKSVVAAK